MVIKYEREIKYKINGSYVYGSLKNNENEKNNEYLFHPNWETMSARMNGPLNSRHLQVLIAELQELKDNLDAYEVAKELTEDKDKDKDKDNNDVDDCWICS